MSPLGPLCPPGYSGRGGWVLMDTAAADRSKQGELVRESGSQQQLVPMVLVTAIGASWRQNV